MKVVLAGGAGFIGPSLWPHFRRAGHEVVVLTRRERPAAAGVRFVAWDGRNVGAWAKELDGAGLLFNLAGRSVNCRYHAKNRRLIRDSRLQSTRVLDEAVATCRNPPPLWINASSATIYRHAEDRDMDEETGEIGEGFSVGVCRKWERAFFGSRTPSTRKVALRLAIVMSPRKGGAFVAYRLLARLGLGGAHGKGTQYVSWLHPDDLFGIVEWLLAHPEIEGVLNACAPHPLVNREFMKIMRRTCGRSFGLPAAAWMLEIGAFLMRTETELLLKSRRVVPARLLASGYRFRFPKFPGAAADIANGLGNRWFGC